MANIVSDDEMEVYESDGVAMVCVALDQLPTQDIVSITVFTTSGSADGNTHT